MRTLGSKMEDPDDLIAGDEGDAHGRMQTRPESCRNAEMSLFDLFNTVDLDNQPFPLLYHLLPYRSRHRIAISGLVTGDRRPAGILRIGQIAPRIDTGDRKPVEMNESSRCRGKMLVHRFYIQRRGDHTADLGDDGHFLLRSFSLRDVPGHGVDFLPHGIGAPLDPAVCAVLAAITVYKIQNLLRLGQFADRIDRRFPIVGMDKIEKFPPLELR